MTRTRLTPAQRRMLARLYTSPRPVMSTDELDMPGATMHALERRGLIANYASSGHGPVGHVELTDEGVELIAAELTHN